jgi:hypothetical protein
LFGHNNFNIGRVVYYVEAPKGYGGPSAMLRLRFGEYDRNGRHYYPYLVASTTTAFRESILIRHFEGWMKRRCRSLQQLQAAPRHKEMTSTGALMHNFKRRRWTLIAIPSAHVAVFSDP